MDGKGGVGLAVAHSFDRSPTGISADDPWMRHLGHPLHHHFHSRGVRDSLCALLGWLARRGRLIALPCQLRDGVWHSGVVVAR
jgi:hypothetical protein